jgi:hypothetical protein
VFTQGSQQRVEQLAHLLLGTAAERGSVFELGTQGMGFVAA